MRVIIAPHAGVDLERLREFLAERNPTASERASRAILDRLNLLSQFPALGKPLGGTGLRELYVPFGKSAYVIRYSRSRTHNALIVLRIWHAREQRR